MGAAGRERAERLHWSAAVEGFAEVADEALDRARRPSDAAAAAASRRS
jgi:hypothetical protein